MASRPPDDTAQATPVPRVVVEETGRTVGEAVERALSVLGVSRGDADVEVLDEGSRGILGIGAREARVRVRSRSQGPAAAGVIKALAEELIARMGFEAEVKAEEGKESLHVAAEGKDLGALIGKHGQTLGALEALLALIAARRLGTPTRLELDVMGYRERRRSALEAVARRTADRVARSGREVALSPMDARDRRIVHMTLQDNPAVTTASRGEGDLRRVVVMPREGAGPAREPGREVNTARRTSSQERGESTDEGASHRGRGATGSPSGRQGRGTGPNPTGRGAQSARSGQFQDRPSAPPRGLWRGQSRRSPGPGMAAPGGGRPEGLPVDEELEAEIQAYLERASRSNTGGKPEGEKPPRGEEPGDESMAGGEGRE